MSDRITGVGERGVFFNLKVRARLVLGFAAICSVLIVVVGITVFRLGEVVDGVHRIDELRIPSMIATGGMARDIQSTQVALRDWMLTGEQSYRAARAQAWTSMDARIAAMDEQSKNWTNPQNVKRWAELKGVLREFQIAQQKVEDAAGSPDGSQAKALLATEVRPRAATILAILLGELQSDGSRAGGMAGNQIQLLSSDVDSVLAHSRNLISLVWLLLSIGLLVSMVIVLFTSRSIANPLVALTEAVKGLAAGDRSANIPALANADEIGDLARAVRSLRDNMRR